MTDSSFYVVALEPGAENPAIPTWANKIANPIGFQENVTLGEGSRINVDGVSGAFQLLGVLSPTECQRLVETAESVGFLEDAAVTLPRTVRHNHSLTWVMDEHTSDLIWFRCAPFFDNASDRYFGKRPVGLNNRFRFYRYQEGDFFKFHTDGSWPGSRIVDGDLVANAYPDRWSMLTFLLFLSDEYEGGETQFNNAPDAGFPGREGCQDIVDIRTPLGGVLCFPHGDHPMHCAHGSSIIRSGTKYIVRTDVLFEL